MATAEQLLHEARYAVNSISFGQSRQNRRMASKARSLCRRIIRRYPTSVQAGEARIILDRLGETALSPGLSTRPQQIRSKVQQKNAAPAPAPPAALRGQGEDEALNWSALLGLIFKLPKAVLAAIAFAGFILITFFGPLLLVPLVALVFLTGPFRHRLKPDQQKAINALIARANEYLEKQARQG